MVMLDFLINNCGKDCKFVIREQVWKRIVIIIFGFFVVVFIIFLCIVVGVLYEKKKIFICRDCVLCFILEIVIKFCLFVDQYLFLNEIYVRICVNEIVQIDIR